MKPLLLTALLLLSFFSEAQQSDFFLLKKRSGKTEQSYFRGSFISFITNDQLPYSGYIKKVAKDSVWVEYREVMRNMTVIGSVILDTVTYEAKRFAVKDIAAIAKDERGFGEVALSGLLKVGAAGYILLHTVNGVIQKEKISLRNIGIAAGVYLAGVVINKFRKDYYHVGRRFRLQYISLSDNAAK